MNVNTKEPQFIMVCGLPGSGKSTYAKELTEEYQAVHISSDDIRMELFGDYEPGERDTQVFSVMYQRTIDALRNGKNVVYDACNISAKKRSGFLRSLSGTPCNKNLMIMATPIEECFRRNKERDRRVPESAIKQMYTHWAPPHFKEGWDYIRFNYPEELAKLTPEEWIAKQDILNFTQDNPHHTENLGEHCLTAASFVKESFSYSIHYDPNVYYASLLHDCGKPATKTPGEDGFSHYPFHANVGAYEAMFFQYPRHVSPLTVSWLIGHHMDPFSWENMPEKGREAAVKKFENIYGRHRLTQIQMLHKADIAAGKEAEQIEEMER
jgi:predicted kinase